MCGLGAKNATCPKLRNKPAITKKNKEEMKCNLKTPRPTMTGLRIIVTDVARHQMDRAAKNAIAQT